MRLSKLIERDMGAILDKWERFAATQLPAAEDMDSAALRDHAEQILLVACRHLDSAETDENPKDSSKRGPAKEPADAPHTAAETHALSRARNGFTVNQLVSEYRALRADVLQRSTSACEPSRIYLRDMVCFNEAIDQAIVESVAFFNSLRERERNLFLGMLGHDLRSPLQVILATSKALSKLDAATEVAMCAARLSKSAHNIKILVDDLQVFNRIKLGMGIPIAPAPVDLAEAFSAELEQLRVAHPSRSIAMEVSGDASGIWDINRLSQLLSNLVENAIKYGSLGSPVRVVINGLSGEVRFSVHNHGPKIEPSILAEIFKPLRRGRDNEFVSPTDGGFGLGLFIAKEIALAHRGDISATSDVCETVFTVRLPRWGDSP